MDRRAFAVKAKGIQIVAAALIVGPVVITGLLVFIRLRQEWTRNPFAENPFANLGFPLWPIPVTLLPIVLLLLGVVGPAVVSGGVESVIRKRRDGPSSRSAESTDSSVDTDVFGVVTGRFMVAIALVEGVGAIGSTAYFFEGNYLALIASAAAISWVAFMFPTTGRLLSEYETVESRVATELES